MIKRMHINCFGTLIFMVLFDILTVEELSPFMGVGYCGCPILCRDNNIFVPFCMGTCLTVEHSVCIASMKGIGCTFWGTYHRKNEIFMHCGAWYLINMMHTNACSRSCHRRSIGFLHQDLLRHNPVVVLWNL